MTKKERFNFGTECLRLAVDLFALNPEKIQNIITKSSRHSTQHNNTRQIELHCENSVNEHPVDIRGV